MNYALVQPAIRLAEKTMGQGACTGLAATIQAPIRLAFVGIALGLLLTALAFLFWKLDQRTSFLVKHAEDAIKKLEPPLATLLTDEVAKTDHARTNAGLWTYGKIFRTIFWVMGLIGLVGAALSALRATHQLDWSEPANAIVPANKAGYSPRLALMSSCLRQPLQLPHAHSPVWHEKVQASRSYETFERWMRVRELIFAAGARKWQSS